jgi:cell division protein ZipA
MEGYLRLALLFIAAAIIFLILYESYNRRRIKPSLSNTADAASMKSRADEILGLHALEPTMHLEQEVDTTPTTAPATTKPMLPPKTPMADDFLVLSVVAKPEASFVSYDLFQSIAATGMQFGDMNIFHFAVPSEHGSQKLFSLASATEPGEFNMDSMGDFTCKGLTLFTNLPRVPDPEVAFELMLKTAEQLADDLDGELRAGMRTPWNEETLQQYQQKVLKYQSMMHA